jgi:glycosyltransferase involved in cell wall biosynthesis
MNNVPKVSVILPVYNGEEYLAEAIESILKQTFRDFELIIIDDGSQDKSAEVVRRFNDPRIRFIEQSNHGLAATLNIGISMAKGEYIARQDQDDVSLPQRLKRQSDFLDGHKDYGLVGSWADIRKGREQKIRAYFKPPRQDVLLRFDLIFGNPFVHSSVMVRKSVFDSVGLYSVDRVRQPPEDYELWSRVARCCKLSNLPDSLLVYREVPTSMTKSGGVSLDHVINITLENAACALGRRLPDPGLTNLAAIYYSSWGRLNQKPKIWAALGTLFLIPGRFSASRKEKALLWVRSFRIAGKVWFHYLKYLIDNQ